MNKLLLQIFMFLLLCGTAWAQTRTVTGKVVDRSGDPLIGVSLLVKGTTQGVSTDVNGAYKINVPTTGNAVLVVRYIGYKTQEIAVGNQNPLNITMQNDDASQLNEVVVVGYEAVKRRDLTGSVSSVGAKQLKDIPLSNAAEALTGRLAGVQVTTTEGAPGADVLIRVRGGSSITQDNSPIYIVDGIQVENALSVISPQDIASVDVLKDASTTAIYGARGANGVVIITTKGGRAGKTVVAYNGAGGFRKITKTMDVLSPYDYTVWQYERTRSSQTDRDNFAKQYGSTFDTLQVYKNKPFINWQDEVFGRSAAFQQHNVSISGGDVKTTFNLSLTANNEDGILLESGFKRYLTNFRLDHQASDKLKVGVTMRYTDQVVKGAGTTNSGTRTTNRLRHSIVYRPFDLPTVPTSDQFDEDYYLNSNQIQNPVILTQAEYRNSPSTDINLSGYINYQITKDLTFRSTGGFDNANSRVELFYSKITPTARNFGSLPLASIATQRNITINNSNTLQYVKNGIGKHHDISVLLGQEIYEYRSNAATVETRYFPADISASSALANLGLGSPPTGSTQPRPTTTIAPPNRIFSLFSRVSYAYDKNLLASVTVRGDRSSKFAADNGLLLFPSGNLAYRFSEADFMKKLPFINDAKLRLGYGVAGNNRIGDLLYLQLYSVAGEYSLNHTVLPGFSTPALANPNLRWERNVSQSIGLDLSMFKDRVQFTTDVYFNKGKDLLLLAAIPQTTGYSTGQLQNIGSTSNKGVEFQVNATAVRSKNFNWTSNFNISFNRNKVLSLGTVTQQTRSSGWQGSDGADDYIVQVGKPVGQMYGFVTDGYYQISDFNYANGVYTLKNGVPSNISVFGAPQPGTVKLKDIDGDGQVTLDRDRTIIGNANPKFTGGWNNQFSYKNFDMSIFVNFVYGNDVYNANKLEWTDGSFLNLNMLNIMKDRWTNINSAGVVVTDPTELAALNANAKIWSPVRNQRYYLHSFAIEDGSFLRINNITFGYTLPKSLVKRVGLTNARFYATVNNVGTITGYSGYDPEISTRRTDPLTQGVDFAGYPRARLFTFGTNITF
ncbi:TonB-dependent receptor [Mucilaginibacter sp. PAMB04168]|uniref:SusC/RagA family TonB-linked outer membrane protein n=1 Tax=Mucilaginibacter sp. PAMB04168 TaxID=3138567 RepID=UPI0031F68F76